MAGVALWGNIRDWPLREGLRWPRWKEGAAVYFPGQKKASHMGSLVASATSSDVAQCSSPLFSALPSNEGERLLFFLCY